MTAPPTRSSVTVGFTAAAARRSYEVVVGERLLEELGDRLRSALTTPNSGDAGRAFVICDDNLPESTLATALESLSGAGFAVTWSSVHAVEPQKSIGTVERLLGELAETRADRADPVVALGGGIVGDIAGFVAASYKRGAPVVQCPTTLLAMVDASVGGKTGVNLSTATGLKKNMVGAFWQPSLVLADTATLQSLPERYLRAGLAECLKHALLCAPYATAPSLFEWTTSNAEDILARDARTTARLVALNVGVKAAVVADDERELADDPHRSRALLNLGHTFAHAIEPIAAISPTTDPADAPLQHGEAVALGLVAAAFTSSALGTLDDADAQRIRTAVELVGLPSRIAGLPDDATLLEAMTHDKKARAGAIRFVLPQTIGTCRVVSGPPTSAISAGFRAIRA